jgi:hypothetical protein
MLAHYLFSSTNMFGFRDAYDAAATKTKRFSTHYDAATITKPHSLFVVVPAVATKLGCQLDNIVPLS